MAAICFEPVAGASGDMILAALFDLGADPGKVEAAIRAAGIEGVSIEFRCDEAGGLRCGFCEVHAPHEHVHRHLSDILEIIERAPVSAAVQAQAAKIFHRLGECEAAVHGIDIEKVHFHEVGALDTIVDVLGACIALEELGVEHVYCSEFKVGKGTVKCAHGVLPVPAPATVRLLEGQAIRKLDIESELTTPTGAAILTTLSRGGWYQLTHRLLRCGTGHGRREFAEVPNVIRAYLVEEEPSTELVELLETDIDDQSPEVTAMLAERLRQQGALDVTLVPVHMKKGRIGTRLSVLVGGGRSASFAETIFRESSTIGMRIMPVRRLVLAREQVIVDTPWGEVQAKRVERPGGFEIVPEADSARAVAASAGVPVRQVMDAVRRWPPAGGHNGSVA
jgi:uncharacterized protein (TIGR00299 family) protein